MIDHYWEEDKDQEFIDWKIASFNLTGNGDRHHYETFKKGGNEGMLLHLDNAKR